MKPLKLYPAYLRYFLPETRLIYPRRYSHSDKNREEIQGRSSLDEKVAIINGGASGIGLAIAREFLRKGMQSLAIIDKDKHKGVDAVEELGNEFGDDKVLFFDCDVTVSKQLDMAYRSVLNYYETIDIVVNSAGMMNDTEWEQQLNTNIAGCAVGTLLGMQYMSRSSNGGGGVVANIASVMGLAPSAGYPVHTMTQFAVCGFSRALGCGKHYERTGVKIIGVCPGLTDTGLLAEAPKHAINDNFADEFLDEVQDVKVQKPESVARGLVEVLDVAKPGSIWVVADDDAPYEVEYPGVVLKEEKGRTAKEKAHRSATL